jgi:hypothetical protein
LLNTTQELPKTIRLEQKSGPTITAHGSLDLKQEIQIGIQIEHKTIKTQNEQQIILCIIAYPLLMTRPS